jgi:hypothetical protein
VNLIDAAKATNLDIEQHLRNLPINEPFSRAVPKPEKKRRHNDPPSDHDRNPAIPPYLPSFPPMHTYIYTLDPVVARQEFSKEQAANERRKVEDRLAELKSPTTDTKILPTQKNPFIQIIKRISKANGT